jgi:quercetin dioxygenase-like cupin family protein
VPGCERPPLIGIITEGRITFQIEGGSIQQLKPGDAFYEPADTKIAQFNNTGDKPAKFAVFYLLGEGEKETTRVLAQ